MAKKSDKVQAAQGSTTEPSFITVQAGLNPITVGSVPLGMLSFRRENYRKMTPAQKKTLRGSTDSLGFQSFILVIKEADGTYGIVDGHHRRDELEEQGAATAPVILLPEGTDPKKADLGMFSFNVSAEIQDDKFAKMVLEMLESGVAPEEVGLHAGVSEDFMKGIQEMMAEPIPEPGTDDLPREGSGDKPERTKKVPAVKLVMILSRDEEGNVAPYAFTMTHKDTIISREVREAFDAQGLEIEEVEPIWFADETELVVKLDEMAQEPAQE
jgi:hypothetical protein